MSGILYRRAPGADDGGGAFRAPVPLAPEDMIERAVVEVFGVSGVEFELPTRGRAEVALARQVAMYLSHVALGLSLTDVGRLFRRDRTTVAHACAVVEDRRDDAVFDRVLDLLEWIVAALADRCLTAGGRA